MPCSYLSSKALLYLHKTINPFNWKSSLSYIQYVITVNIISAQQMVLVSRAACIWEHVWCSQGLVFIEVTVQHPGGDVLSVRSTIKAQPAIPNDIAQRRRCWLCGAPLVRQGNECWQSHCVLNAGWPMGGQGKSCSMMSQVSMCYPQSVREEKKSERRPVQRTQWKI